MSEIKSTFQTLNSLLKNKAIRAALLSFVIFFVLLTLSSILYANWSTLINYEWHINYRSMGLTFVFYTLNLIAAIYGWAKIMGGLEKPIDFREHFRIYVLTNLAKRIPGSLWHIAGRFVMYEQLGVSKSSVALASAIEAVLLLDGAIIAYFLASTLGGDQQNLEWRLLGVLGIGLLSVHPRILRLVLTKLKGVQPATHLHYRHLMGWLLIYIVSWSLGGGTLFWLINTVTPVPVQVLPQVMATWGLVGSLSSLIFFSPSGLGVQEITVAVSIGQIIPTPIAVIVAILLRLMLTGYQLAWAGLILLAKRLFWSKIEVILPKEY